MKIFCLLLTLSLAVDGQGNAGQMVGKPRKFSVEIYIFISSPLHKMASAWTQV
jgi:hypothetical protein